MLPEAGRPGRADPAHVDGEAPTEPLAPHDQVGRQRGPVDHGGEGLIGAEVVLVGTLGLAGLGVVVEDALDPGGDPRVLAGRFELDELRQPDGEDDDARDAEREQEPEDRADVVPGCLDRGAGTAYDSSPSGTGAGAPGEG